MITNYQDYENKLWSIEKQMRTSTAILLPTPPKEELIPIDLNERKIKVPKSFIIVSQDHSAETLYFTFDRYFDGMDLSNTCCIIQFQNAKGEAYYYVVPYMDITTDNVNQKIIMPWVIQNAATQYAGIIKFAIKFFKLDATGHLIYELNTLIAEAIVEQGQTWDLDNISQDNFVFDKVFLEAIHDFQEIMEGKTIIEKNENGETIEHIYDMGLWWIDNF